MKTKKTITNKPKIKRLFFDIETSPNVVYSWNVGYKLNISHDNIIQERAIICICYKWEGSSKVHSLVWNKGDDAVMIREFFKVISTADEVVGHNGDQFDIKWFKTRAIYHGITDMPPIKSIDTLKIARAKFRFNSNRLDYIAKFLKLGAKIKLGGGFELWKDIILNHNKISENKLVKYCKMDVSLLEKIYNKLEPYSSIKTHVGVLNGESKCSCPKCGSLNTIGRGITVSSAGVRKQIIQCKNCNRFTVVPFLIKQIN